MQVRQPAGAVRLRIRPRVACVSSVAGGEKTLEALRAQLEEICSSSPPLRVPPDSRVLADVLQLLINQGESLCERRTHLLALMK